MKYLLNLCDHCTAMQRRGAVECDNCGKDAPDQGWIVASLSEGNARRLAMSPDAPFGIADLELVYD